MIYVYELKLRPFGVGTAPRDGFVSHVEVDGSRWGHVTYNRQLTETEISDFELRDLNTDSERELKINSILTIASEVKNVGAAKLAALKNNLATCDDATLDRLHKHYTGAKG